MRRWRRFRDPHPSDGLDVAFIQNISDSRCRSTGCGQRDASDEPARRRMRKRAVPSTGSPSPSGELTPGETVAVPLAISFVMADSLKPPFANSAGAAKTFKAIQSTPPGTVIELKDEGGDTPAVVRRSRESFGPPTTPKPATYIYGPELPLKGLVSAAITSFSIRLPVISCSSTAGEG